MQHINYLALFTALLLFFNSPGFAQHSPTISLGAGLLAGQEKRNENTGLLNASGLTLGFSMPFLKRQSFSVGLGLTGDYLTATRVPELPLNAYLISGGNTLAIGTGGFEAGQRVLRIGAGPELDLRIGKKMVITPKLHMGIVQTQRDGFSILQQVEYGKEIAEKEIYGQDRVASTGMFYAPKLRLSIPLGNRLSAWGEANVAIQRVEINERMLQVAGAPNEDGAFEFGTWKEGRLRQEQRSVSWNTLGAQAGISLVLGKKDQLKRGKGRQADHKAPNPKQPYGTVTNTSTEQDEQRRRLVTASPDNNARYINKREIKSLQWRVAGPAIPAPAYVVELIQLDRNLKPQRTYIGKSDHASIDIDAFGATDLPDGKYHWRVTETTTGLVSDTRAFNISNCAIDFSIENDTIACLGYEETDRKYRICFDAAYESSSGDLAYSAPTSGLFVYDQQYTPLSYTLVGQNTSLVNQSGTSLSTVQYCIEVTAPAGVTAIGLALQGDDLDPSPVLCQPGVSLMVDSLPDCLCDDCETMDVVFGTFDITAQNGQGTQYLFDGEITANQPVYGVEVQVLSYQYTATPGGCTTGVSGVETSGIIFPAQSTINGSGSLQAGGSPSKIVRYLSTAALTGTIPLQLAIGLPGTLPGFDADCCAITYEVCLKVNVLYNDGSCKACSFTHCFQFANQ